MYLLYTGISEVNECLDSVAPCSQGCTDQTGGFNCHCDDDLYELAADNVTCRRVNPPFMAEPWLVVANKHYIRRLSMDGGYQPPVL